MQEEGQAALLCLACGQKTPDSPVQILVARIGDSQAADHQDIQVRVLPGIPKSSSLQRCNFVKLAWIMLLHEAQ